MAKQKEKAMKTVVKTIIATVILAATPALAEPNGTVDLAPAAEQQEQAASKRDLVKEAQKRLDGWHADKKACLRKHGLVEGQDFRAKPGAANTYQVRDSVLLAKPAVVECQ